MSTPILKGRKLAFNSPLLIGLLVLFVGLGTYAVLRSRAATGWPVPQGRAIKIVAFGDSLTSELAETGAASTIGTKVTAAGFQATSSAMGYGGYCTIDTNDVCKLGGLMDQVGSVTGQNPDIVLLNAGTNDQFNWQGTLPYSAFSIQNTPAIAERIGQLADKIQEANSNILVLITTPREQVPGDINAALETEIRKVVDAKIAAGKYVGYVNAYVGVTQADYKEPYTNIHLNDSGYAKMATSWADGIVAYIEALSASPTPTSSPTVAPTTGPTPITGVTPVPQPAPATNAVLTMNSTTTTIESGQTFTVQLKVNSKQPFDGMDASLVYPADKLELVTTDILTSPAPDPAMTLRRLSPGALPAETRAPGNLPILFIPIAENGDALDPMPAGDHAIMTVTFKALAATGSATISYNPNAGITGTAGQLMEAAGSWVVGFGGGTTNPTPTNSPNPTPTTTPNPTPTTIPTNADANMYLSATPNPVQAGQNVTVTIRGNFKQSIAGGEVHLKYDPTKLEYVSSVETDGLVSGEKIITSAENGIFFTVFMKPGGLTGDKGLINVTFKALASTGNVELSYAPETAIPGFDSGQELSESLTPLTLNFGSGSTNPTPTASPTAVPTGNPTPNPTANPTPISGQNAQFYFTAIPTTIQQNGTVTVTVRVNTPRAINAGELYVSYDSTKLQYIDAVHTDALSTGDIIIKSSDASNVFLVFMKQGSGISGDVALANITFKALAGAGTTALNVGNQTQVADAVTLQTLSHTATPITLTFSTPTQPTPVPVQPTPVPVQPTPIPQQPPAPTPRPSTSSGGTRTGSTLPSSTRPVNPTQPAQPQPTPAPGTGIPTRIVATNIGRNTATITWTTAIKTTGVVEYGTTSAYGFQAEQKNLDTNHSVTLPPQVLIPGTTFHYRIKATDEKGTQYVSGDQTFKTKGYSVVVEVKDNANKAVKGATVNFGTDLKASTDAAGKASFPDAPGGSVQVKVSYNGQNAEKTVTVQDSAATQTFTIQLSAATTQKKKTSIWVPIIIGIGLIALIGLIIVGIRYMRGNSSSNAYYDTVVPNTYGGGAPDPNQPQQQAGERHEYPW